MTTNCLARTNDLERMPDLATHTALEDNVKVLLDLPRKVSVLVPAPLYSDSHLNFCGAIGALMPSQNPPNAENVQRVVEERLHALDTQNGLQETVTIEWRGTTKTVPVITMPTDLLFYNPDTHRVRAQRSMDPARDEELKANPYSAEAQGYLQTLLMGDPSDPAKVDPSFTALKDDLKDHGQREPGLISRAGVLVNGNTRQAALKSLGFEHIRVGVLPADTSHDDFQSIELSLQLRRDHRRDYSFMNFLLAVDERAAAGQPVEKIMDVFHIKESTYERARWILEFVRDAISRSAHKDQNGNTVAALSLVGALLVEAKLTESDFQTARYELIRRYQDLEAVFEVSKLSSRDGIFIGYQLIRGALAAYATGCSFCVLCDARRPDLIEVWYRVMRAVHDVELRCRLKLLTWQELAFVLPNDLQTFLEEKYGIFAQ